jgi:hypothetical protein
VSNPLNASEWTLGDHLGHGETAIAKLLSMPGIQETDPRVCFHFYPNDNIDDDNWGDDAAYVARAKPLLDALPFWYGVDYVGGPSGIEGWEKVVPSIAWLHQRIPPLLEVATRADLYFGGWSFEPVSPRNFAFVSCGASLDVVNANTPEGRAAIDDMIHEIDPANTKNN